MTRISQHVNKKCPGSCGAWRETEQTYPEERTPLVPPQVQRRYLLHKGCSVEAEGGVDKRQVVAAYASSAVSQPHSLPCNKMITTGICTYRSRCHYIHDVRIRNSAVKGSCRKKNKAECSHLHHSKDLFFWPPMTPAPDRDRVARSYSVSGGSDFSNNSHETVASLWHYFVEMCMSAASNNSVCGNLSDTQAVTLQHPSNTTNAVTKRPRLSIFVKLAGDNMNARTSSNKFWQADHSDDLRGVLSSNLYNNPVVSYPRQSANSSLNTRWALGTAYSAKYGQCSRQEREYLLKTIADGKYSTTRSTVGVALEKYIPVIQELAHSKYYVKRSHPSEQSLSSTA